MSRFGQKALMLALLATFTTAYAIERPVLLPPVKGDSIVPKTTKPPKPPLRLLHTPVVSFPETTGIEITPATATAPYLDLFQKAGFRWARVDVPWDGAEKQRGVYDLSAYETLAAELKRRDIEPLFTLGFLNPLYDSGQPPHSAEALAAYSSFSGAAARQLRSTVKNWEIGSEPNSEAAWKSQPNPADYAALALAAEKSLRSENPKAFILSGGLRGVDLPFLQAAFSHGLARAIDGIALHLSTDQGPEALEDQLKSLRSFLEDYAPRRGLEIRVSKTGFTGGENKKDTDRQPDSLVRSMLYDFGKSMSMTIWSPDKGSVPEPLVVSGPAQATDPTQSPNTPAFRALASMNRLLNGAKLLRVRELPPPMNGLVFSARRKQINIFWSSNGDRELKVNLRGAPSEGMPVYNVFGEPQASLKGKESTLHLTESPLYVEGRLDVVGCEAGP